MMIWVGSISALVLAFALQAFFFVVWFKRQNATPEELETNRFLVATRSLPNFSYFFSVLVPMSVAAWGIFGLFVAVRT